ncbi:MAG: hypothetical protein AAF699_15550 [Pseudomonadota bacterium]
MFIRFVIHDTDEDSGKRKGLFQASYELREAGALDRYEEERLITILEWFNKHLARPHSLSKSRKPHAKNVAISWFKDSAQEHIAKMFELKTILESHDLGVDVIRTTRPGYVVYEDEFQLTAQPYAETLT